MVWWSDWSCLRHLIPSPGLMMETLIKDWGTHLDSLMTTMKITVLSFVVAVIVGVLISFLFVQSRLIETALFPYAVLLQVTPIVAIAPLIIIWVKQPTASLVVCAALVALFPIISNTTLGLRSIDPRPAGLLQDEPGHTRPGSLALAHPKRVTLLLRWPAHFFRFGADRRGGGRIRRWHRGLPTGLAYQILMAGYQLDIPAHVRGAVADLTCRRIPVRAHGLAHQGVAGFLARQRNCP